MKTLAILSVLGFALTLPSIGYAAGPPAGKSTFTTGARVTNAQTAVACNMCYSCGGDWPVFAGISYSPQYAYERSSSCAGSIAFTSDTAPYLCCR